jgi:uncharacterized protein
MIARGTTAGAVRFARTSIQADIDMPRPGFKSGVCTVSLVVLSVWIFAAVARAQSVECIAPADGAGADLKSPDVATAEPSEIETACRLALRSDPSNAGIMVRLARALSAQNKAREALTLYMEAAFRRNADAMNELGGIFEQGRGIPKNFLTALLWYEKAAEAGHRAAMTHLGQLSEKGVEVPLDLAKARAWYERAANLGDRAAMGQLADLVRSGRGGGQDPAAAAAWYRRAAELGLPSAMTSLAELMEAGIGVPQDYAAARGWYEKAAALGDGDAMGHLGQLLETGQGGPQNVEQAREWYLKGSALNGRIAMHRMGALLESGRWAAKDLPQAKAWYERAAALDYPPALNDLGRMHLDGLGTGRNLALAKGEFERAAQLGSAEAMNNLGVLYFNGTGAERDVKAAKSWLEKALALRNSDAAQNLEAVEKSAHLKGSEIGARRAACGKSCAAVQSSYASSVCARFVAAAKSKRSDSNSAEREKCTSAAVVLVKACRDSCWTWGLLSEAENTCMTCFSTFVACAASSDASGSAEAGQTTSACQVALEQCKATCAPLRISASGIGPVARSAP